MSLISLDLQDNGTEEWQYVSTFPFSNWTLATDDPTGASFRQVSSDPSSPAYFCRNPSLVYGATGGDSSAHYRQGCELVSPLLPAELIEVVLARTIPAFPIADVATLRQAYSSPQGQYSNWYAILTSMLAHVTTYVSPTRPTRSQAAVAKPCCRLRRRCLKYARNTNKSGVKRS